MTKPRNQLHNVLKPGQSEDAAGAEFIMQGTAANAVTTCRWSHLVFGQPVDVTECDLAMLRVINEIKEGSLAPAEAILTAQALTLNAMFTNFAERARQAKLVETFEQSMRLALKAQSQCRATLETLAAIKNPPVVFARQANISQGPQQVNNGTEAPSRAKQFAPAPSKLLDGDHGERLDEGTQGETVDCDHRLEPMEAVHRAPKRRR
ncbi:MAG TPA: hypothetical protein VNJ04_07610 [Gemmatimonadaceae bacterium]|nr:hypothetical protein [Gemmatimonadaceae bacterium]